MHTLFSPGIGRLGAILACGLAFWAAGAGRAIADDPPTCGCGCNSDCDTPVFWQGYEPLPSCPWYFSAEGLALQRLFPGLGLVATDGRPPTQTSELTEHSMDEPFQAGTRFLIGHTFEDAHYQVEALYYWPSPWDTSAQAIDPNGNLFSPFTILYNAAANPFVDGNSLVEIHQVSRLENGEINLKCTLPLPAGDPTIQLMFGVRHVGIREEFDYYSVPTGNPNPVSVHAHTNNVLWGPQIGGVVDCGHQDVWIRVEGKAALCDNETDRDLAANVNGTETTHARIFHSGTAEVADISASILWRPTAMLTAKIGYQALWCDQLALASRNYAPDLTTLTNPAIEPAINTRGTLIYHGPFAGLQLNW